VSLDPYNAFLHRADADGDWRVAVKDVIDVAGMPTTAASKVLHRVPDRDAECVARLRAAGATIVGKLNTHEFAFGAITNSPHFGPALNPWDPTRMTGGSSGGSAAAVAAGLVDLAVGTDTAGSVRIPSAFCGVTGHKPTWGLVPSGGVFPTAWSLDTVGPLARSAEECRRALEIMAGHPLEQNREIRRVGLVTRLFEQADPGVAPVCADAAGILAPGAEPIELPLHEEISTITQLVMLPEAAAVHKHWLRTKLADYGPDVRARALAGLLLPSTAHVTGLRARNWARELWARELGANFLRLAHYPHSELTVREADRLGILLWSEIPVYWTIQWENPATLENARNQLGELIDRDKNRAAVIIWSVANETPLSDERLSFLKNLVSHARSIDPTRLLSAAMERHYINSTTQMIDDPLGEFLDVLGCNEYVGWYDGLPGKADALEWKSKYNKPLIMSEFGADAAFGHHGDALTRWTEEYQEDLYRHQIGMLKKIPFLRGTSPWILMDFRSPRRPLPGIQDYWNRKGLISNRGEKKKAFYVMQRWYRELRDAPVK